VRFSKVVHFLTLLSIAAASSTVQAQMAPSSGWRVEAYFAPTLPVGVIPQFTVDIVEPANCLCDLDV
jgi:hypothetical protein